MSWAKDEWKDGLSAYVLKHISELEQQNERIVKDNKQKQFQLESCTAALEKQKCHTEEEKARYASLKKENQTLSESCNEAERNKQKILHELHSKDSKLSCVEGQLNRLKQCLESETNKATQLKNDLEKIQYERTQSLTKYEKQCAELSKLQEHNSFQKRQLEGQTEKIRSLETQLRQYGDYSNKSFSSRSSSQSSYGDAQHINDFVDSELQAKYDTEVQQRQKIEQELMQLQQQIKTSSQEPDKPVIEKPPTNDIVQEMPSVEDRESLQLKQQLVDLKSSVSKLELQLQATQKELRSKTDALKEKEVELIEIKQNFDNKIKQSAHVSEELVKTTSQLDKTMTQLEALGKKSKQLGQELECQRHNSEAVIKGHEEKLKEKEKQFREDLSSQTQALTALDKQHQELLNKMQQEQQTAQAAQRELQGKLDHSLQETQRLKLQLTDAKNDDSNKNHALKAKDQTITDLGQEIKSLKQEKNNIISELDREATNRKKMEDHLNAAKNELSRKDDCIKIADTKAMEQITEMDKMRKQALCDLENLRTVQAKLESEKKDLKKQIEAALNGTARKEQEMTELKLKLESYEKDIQRVNQEVLQLKTTISDNKESHLRLEGRLKEADQASKAKDNEIRNMSTKVEQLENKCSSLLQELETKKFEYDETRRKNSELQNKHENTQKILEVRTSEVHNMKKSVSEFEDLQRQQSSVTESRVVELEKQLVEEASKCIKLEGEVDKVKRELIEEKQTEDELRRKLEESAIHLKEHQENLTKKDKDLEEQKKNFKNELVALEENIAVVKKEKEQEKQEFSKTMHQKNEELFGTLDELEKKSNEVLKLKETHINLQNMLTAHEQEKTKMEKSFKEQCENTQKKEEELLAKCEELEMEKRSFVEKEKNLNIAKEALKRDIKALQNDYKKACELSDSKSAELKELVDKFEATAKEFEHWRQRAVHSETSLKNCEERIKEIFKEKEGYVKDLAVKEEEIETIKRELAVLSSEKQDLMSKAEERCGVLTEKLNKEAADREDKAIEAQNLARKISELETALKNSDASFLTLNEAYENKDKVIKKKESEIEDLVGQLKATETALRDLQQELNKKSYSDLEQKYRQLELHNEEQLEIIKSKEQEVNLYIKDLDNLRTCSEEETVNLRQKVDSLEKEVCDLRQKKSHLESSLESRDTEMSSLRSECLASSESLATAHEAIQSKEREISEIVAVKTNLEVKLNDVVEALRVKEQEAHDVNQELTELQKNFDVKLHDLNSKVFCANEELETLRSQLQQMQQSLEISTTKLTEVQEELQTKNTELVQAQGNCLNMKEMYEEIKKKEDDFLEQSRNLNAALEVKSKELESNKEELQKLQDTYGSHATDFHVKENKLNEKIAEMTDEIERVDKNLKAKEEELGIALEKVNNMEVECNELRSMMDESAEMVIALQEQNTTLTQKEEQLNVCLEQKKKELMEVCEKQEALEVTCQSSSEQLNIDLEKMNLEMNELKQKLSIACELEESRLKEIASLKDKATSEQNDRNNLATKLENLQKCFDSLQDENTNLVQKKQQLSEVIANKDTELTTMKAELEGIKADLESTVQESSSEMTELREKASLMVKQAGKHEELMTVKEQQLNQLSLECEELQKEFNKLRTVLEDKDTMLNNTKEELGSLVIKNEMLSKLLENKSQEFNCKSEETQKNVEKIENELQRQRDVLDNTSRELDTALSEKEKLAHLLEAKEKEMLKLTEMNEEYSQEKENIRQKLNDVENALQVKSGELNCLEEQKIHLKRMVETLNTEKDALLKEGLSLRGEANDEIGALRIKLKESIENITQLTEGKTKMEDRVQVKESELQNSKERSMQLEKDLESLTAQKEILQMDFEDKDELIESYKIQINQLEALVKDMQQKSQEKEDCAGNMTRDMEALRSQLEVTQMDVEDKEEIIEELKSKVTALESQVKNYKESINVFKGTLETTQAALEQSSLSLDEKTKALEAIKAESGINQEKSGEVVESLKKAMEELRNEKNDLEKRFAEKEGLVESLGEEVSLFQGQIEALSNERENIQSTFSSKIASLKMSKESSEKQLEEIENQLKITTEEMERNKDELNVLKESMATERSNLFNSNKEMATQKESMENEMKVILEKLQETEEALDKTRSELAKTLEEKGLSESMLVAVDGNLQTFKKLVIEKEQRIKELEALLAEKEDEVLKLKGIASGQEDELCKLRNGISENCKEKDTLAKEMEDKLQNIEESRKMEIETLSKEFKVQIEDLKEQQQLSLENTQRHKGLISELENNIASSKQEVLELNQVIESKSAEIEVKALEIENLKNEFNKLQFTKEELQQSLNIEIQSLKNDIQGKEEDLRRKEEKMTNLAMDTEVKNEENVLVLASVRQENKNLEDRLQSLSQNLETIENDLRKSRYRVEELETALQETKDQNYAEYSKLQDQLKEVEESKAEVERTIHQDKDQVLNELKNKEKELSHALNYEKEQNENLNGEVDKLRDRLTSLVQSSEEIQKEQQQKILELSAQLEETKQSLKMSCTRVEELLEEKRLQFDGMQVAERERQQARSELEQEIASSKQRARRLNEEVEEYKQYLDKLENEKNVHQDKFKQMQARYQTMEENLKECDLKYQEKLAELSSSLQSTEYELRKTAEGKNEVSSMFKRCKDELEQALERMTRVENEKEDTELIARQRDEMKGTIELLQEQVSSLETERLDLLSKLKEEGAKFSCMKEKAITFEQDIESIRSRQDENSSKLKQTIKELEKKNFELTENILKSSEISEDKLRTCNQKIEEVTNEKEALGIELKGKCCYAKQLEDSNDELLEVNEKLCQKIETLEEAIQEKIEEITSHRGQASSVNQDYEDALHELESLRQESSVAIEKREDKINSLTLRLEDIQKSLDEMSQEKKLLVREKEDLLDQITSAKQLKEEALKEADEKRVERQDQSVLMDEKNSKIIELTNQINNLQQTIETRHREYEEMKNFFDSTNEDLDALCEQRGGEIENLKRELNTTRQGIQELERKMQEKEEDFESLSLQLHEVTKHLERLTEEHESCKDYQPRIEEMKQDVQQAEYALAQEKSNSEALLKSFEKKELRWEEEREKLVNSVKNSAQDQQAESNLRYELSCAEDKIKELLSSLNSKDVEMKALQQLTEEKTSTTEELQTQFKSKMIEMEQTHQELKYQLKQKEEELFVLEEKLKERQNQIQSLEKKLASSEEIELELRHHLGDVTQQLEKLREPSMKDDAISDELERLRIELNDALEQVSNLKVEARTKDTQFEEEKSRIVEAAKEFAVKREEEFVQQLASKEEQLNGVENELNQLKHDLHAAQQSQKALLEAADEREREFEVTKNKLQDGSLTQGKFIQLSLQLKSEKQRSQQLEENCKRLQEVIDDRQLTVSSLQKQIDGLKKNHVADQGRFETEVTSLNQEIKRLEVELKQGRESLAEERARVKELTLENESLCQTLKEFKSEAQREKEHSSETEEECKVLKEQLNGMMDARSEAEIEKEELIVSESKEKEKLREIERQLEQLTEKLDSEMQVKRALEDKAKEFETELIRKVECLASIQEEKLKLEEKVESLKKQGEKVRKENEELTKLFEELEAIYNEKEKERVELKKKLKTLEEERENLNKDNIEEVEFLKVQLLIAEEKCSNLRHELEDAQSSGSSKQEKSQENWMTEVRNLQIRIQELETRYNNSKASVAKLDSELCPLRFKVKELEDENESLKLRLKTKHGDDATGKDVLEKMKALEENWSREKSRADEEEKKARETVDEFHAFTKKYKNLERQNISLQRRLQFATEKLKNNNKAGDDCSSGQSQPSAASSEMHKTATSTNPASMLSPLARSMSSLGITTSSCTVTTAATDKQPVRSFLPPPRPLVQECALPVRAEQPSRLVSKLNKRTAERDTFSVSKRHRVSSQGDSVPGGASKQAVCDSPDNELPEGLPEVVSKGFNDIPDVPIKSPFILRRTTAQIPKNRSDKPSLEKHGIKTRSQIAKLTQRTNIPTVNRATSKENPSGLRSPPRTSRLAAPQMVLSPRKTNIARPSEGPSPKKSHLSNIPTKRANQYRTSRRSLGKNVAPRGSSLKQPMKIKPLEGSPAKSSEDQADKCAMQ